MFDQIKLNGLQISWVDEIKHLGNYINYSMSDKIINSIVSMSTILEVVINS